MLKKVLRVLLLLCIGSNCQALTEKQLERLIAETRRAVLVVDEESQKFLNKVLQNPSLFEDDKTYDRVQTLIHRAELISELETYLLNGFVQKPEFAEKIELWLDNQSLLDDPVVRQYADNVVEEIRERLQRRIILYMQLEKVAQMVEASLLELTQEQRHQLDIWLSNPELLDGPEEQDRVGLFIDEISESLSSVSHEAGRKYKFIKYLSLITYTAYRKFRTISDIENAFSSIYRDKRYRLFKLRNLDNLAALSYIVSSEWEKSKGVSFKDFMLELLNRGPLVADSWRKKWGEILKDDVADYIEKRVAKDVPEWPDDSYNDAALAKHKAHMNARRAVEWDVKRNGCQGTEIDMYYTFDRELDKLLEDGGDVLLKKAGIPASLRDYLWKSTPMSMARTIVMFKFVPMLLYWYYQRWRGKGKPLRDYVSFKEVEKSAVEFIKYVSTRAIAKHLNGEEDKDGKGRLDKIRDKTFGLIGPNLIRFALEFSLPRANIALVNKVMGNKFPKTDNNNKGDEDVHIEQDEKGYNEEDGREVGVPYLSEEDYFKENIRPWQRHLAHGGISYAVRNVVFYCMSKVFSPMREKALNWVSQKTTSFIDFLARRGWISKQFWDGLKKEKQDFEMQQEASLSSVFTSLILTTYMLFKGPSRKMTEFDEKEMWIAFSKTQDNWTIIDFLFSFGIGEFFGNWIADKGTGLLEDAGIVPNKDGYYKPTTT